MEIIEDRKTLADFRNAALAAGFASFDLFDTLIIRSVIRPTHMFNAIADRLAADTPLFGASFAKRRVEAEQNALRDARARGEGEVTLAGIYASLAQYPACPGESAPDFAAIMQLEIECEIAGVAPDPAVKAVYSELVEHGCTVAIVSDMYLPRSCIDAMLERTGISGHAALYLSSETGLTKAKGTIWPRLRRDHSLASDMQIPHLGDNPYVDGIVARQHGVNPFLLTEPGKRIRASHFPLTGDWLNDAFHALLLQALKSRDSNSHVDAYWLTIAYLVVAPTVVGMSGFVSQLAQDMGTDRIYFLARDGLIFRKAYEAAWRPATAAASHYVWCSRRCLNMAKITEVDEAALDFLVSGTESLTAEECLQRIDLDPQDPSVQAVLRRHFPQENQTLAREAGHTLRLMFRELAKPLLDRAASERTALLKHLDEVRLFDGPGVVVDLGWRGSLQHSLIEIGKVRNGAAPALTGAYFGTLQNRVKHAGGAAMDARGWMFTDGEPVSTVAATLGGSVSIVELLFSAPESGIRHVSTTEESTSPVRISDREEESRLALAAVFHDAVAHVASALRPYLGRQHIEPLRQLSLRNLSLLLLSPRRVDVEKFKPLSHADGFGKAAYHPIVSPLPVSANPMEWLRTHDYAYWRRGYLVSLPWVHRMAVETLMLPGKARQWFKQLRKASGDTAS